MRPVSVIILNWNGKALLAEFLPYVLRNTNPEIGEIVVADNGSDDGSVDFLEHNFPGVRIIRLDRNYGFAEGYNRAIAQTDSPYCLLLNSDVAPEKGWIEPLYSFMESHPEAGAVQPKIRSYRQREKFEHAGAAGGLIDRHGFPYCLGRVFDNVETDRGQYDDGAHEIFWASGAAMLTRTSLYNECGGLDASFFAHQEEIDFCWRIQLRGWKVYSVPQSVVYHLGGGSLPYSNPRKTYLNFRNNLLMMAKNLPRRDRRKSLIVRRLIDTAAFLKFAVTFDFANAKAVLRAHRDFARMQGRYSSPEGDVPNLLKGKPDILRRHYLGGK